MLATYNSSGTLNGSQDLYMDFTESVSGLSFSINIDNDVGVIGVAEAFSGAISLGTQNIIGDGIISTVENVDLSAFSNVTRVQVTNITDNGGFGYNNIQFTTGAVPEPSALALLGLSAFGIAARRRRAA